MRTLHQLYSFVSSALFGSENEKSGSEEKFKRLVQVLPSNIGPLCLIEFQWVEKFRNK